jgi:hypothetical protein
MWSMGVILKEMSSLKPPFVESWERPAIPPEDAIRTLRPFIPGQKPADGKLSPWILSKHWIILPSEEVGRLSKGNGGPAGSCPCPVNNWKPTGPPGGRALTESATRSLTWVNTSYRRTVPPPRIRGKSSYKPVSSNRWGTSAHSFTLPKEILWSDYLNNKKS